ncbi:hypothetical protein CEXT_472171 [Caerostris extrusa]|uniref:Uncharacterized protein n=1 Tax=Caerostris extrusa TaxID=172846 RepID=A0AAV4UVA2_CAEEX|nr:hypothetical protein CEXT_472171 [Caerostris extrusa]
MLFFFGAAEKSKGKQRQLRTVYGKQAVRLKITKFRTLHDLHFAHCSLKINQLHFSYTQKAIFSCYCSSFSSLPLLKAPESMLKPLMIDIKNGGTIQNSSSRRCKNLSEFIIVC